MAFAFPCKGLLRVRELQERSELQGLQALAAQVAAARAEIAALEAAQPNRSGAASGRTHRPESPARNCTSARRARRPPGNAAACCTPSCRNWNARSRRSRPATCTPARQRETLSHLREQQLAAYDLEQSRRTQRQIDELFLMRLPARKHPDSP